MKELRLLLVFMVIAIPRVYAQTDSVALNPEQGMKDGLYLNQYDFRRNKSITKEEIVSTADKDQLEFLSRTLAGEKFSYKKNGEQFTLECKNVWGFIQNNTFYVNYNNEFYRVPVFGSISFFVATVKVVTPGFYDARFGYMGGGTTTELREFLMNFYDGQVRDYSLEAAEQLLSRDAELYAGFKKLSHRKKKEQLHRFIRRFNELHPVYFLR